MKRLWPALLLLNVVLMVTCSGPNADPLLSTVTPSPFPTSAATQPLATPVTVLIDMSSTAAPIEAPDPTAIPTTTPLLATPAIPTLSSQGAAGQTEVVPILMYHYVRPDPGPNDPIGQDLSVTPADFAAEMRYLADSGYTTMTLGELAGVRDGKLKLPAKPVVLTFDDGYRDFYTYAWPALQQHQLKATVFVITGFVDQPRYLTWDMIRELDQSGFIEVGSHTVHHVDLSKAAVDVASAEVTDSKHEIEQKIGHPIESFCYPSGRYSTSTVSQLRDAGYTIATTTNGGFAEAGDDQLLLPRVRVHGPVGLPALKSTLP